MRGLKQNHSGTALPSWSRIFYRCVDWNSKCHVIEEKFHGRIFYRCVDWNRPIRPNSSIWNVASFTDAWIETADNTEEYQPPFVASFTDAWIETVFVCHVWKRTDQVASFTDAWIETFQTERPDLTPKSHLLQMRGLKQTRTTSPALIFSRIFYRCVDWNSTYVDKMNVI